jgi:hypothetical protein
LSTWTSASGIGHFWVSTLGITLLGVLSDTS